MEEFDSEQPRDFGYEQPREGERLERIEHEIRLVRESQERTLSAIADTLSAITQQNQAVADLSTEIHNDFAAFATEVAGNDPSLEAAAQGILKNTAALVAVTQFAASTAASLAPAPAPTPDPAPAPTPAPVPDPAPTS